jgi:hypothetical protein
MAGEMKCGNCVFFVPQWLHKPSDGHCHRHPKVFVHYNVRGDHAVWSHASTGHDDFCGEFKEKLQVVVLAEKE